MADIFILAAAAPVNDSAAVASNLDHAASTQDIQGEVHAVTEAHGGPQEHHADPSIAGIFNSTVIVSLAMLVFIIVLLWKKVPAMIAGALDGRIAEIRKQLDEAANLRKEAEALKAEYQAKLSAAGRDADALRDSARTEAAAVIESAKVQAAELIQRRQKMAEDKIAAAERTAIADLRAQAAAAATAAAETLIRQHHDAAADSAMVDQAIRQVGTTH